MVDKFIFEFQNLYILNDEVYEIEGGSHFESGSN